MPKMSRGGTATYRPRVLIIADSLEGGLGRAALSEAAELHATGVNALIAAPSGSTSGIEAVHVAVPSGVRDLKGMRRAVRDLRLANKRVRPDLVHAHGLRSFAIARVASPNGRVAVTYHGSPASTQIRVAALAAIGESATAAFSVAPLGIRGWQHVWHWSPEAILRPGLPIPSSAAATHLAHDLSRLGNAPLDSPTVFGWFGRLDAPKRFDLWLYAIEHVAASHSNVRGVVIGDGPLASRCRAAASRSQVPIEFLGPAHPDTAFRAMDVFLTWSDSEGVPFAMQEAIARGIPCFTNDLPGPRAFLGEDSECVLQSPTDARLGAACNAGVRTEIASSQLARMSELQSGPDPADFIARLVLVRGTSR